MPAMFMQASSFVCAPFGDRGTTMRLPVKITFERMSRVILRRLYGSSTGLLRIAAPPIAPGAHCGGYRLARAQVCRLFSPYGRPGRPTL